MELRELPESLGRTYRIAVECADAARITCAGANASCRWQASRRFPGRGPPDRRAVPRLKDPSALNASTRVLQSSASDARRPCHEPRLPIPAVRRLPAARFMEPTMALTPSASSILPCSLSCLSLCTLTPRSSRMRRPPMPSTSLSALQRVRRTRHHVHLHASPPGANQALDDHHVLKSLVLN